MKKYTFKVIPQDGGYVGYALLDDEVVFTTNACKDVVTASRTLSNVVRDQTAPTPPSASVIPKAEESEVVVEPPKRKRAAKKTPTRKCCGRG